MNEELHSQARRRGGSGGSVEPPLKFYSSERTPFEANELTPFKQTNPPPKKNRPQLKNVLKILFSKKKKKTSSVRKKILFSKKKKTSSLWKTSATRLILT